MADLAHKGGREKGGWAILSSPQEKEIKMRPYFCTFKIKKDVKEKLYIAKGLFILILKTSLTDNIA